MATLVAIDPKRLEKLGPAERTINALTTYTDHCVHTILVVLAVFGLFSCDASVEKGSECFTTEQAKRTCKMGDPGCGGITCNDYGKGFICGSGYKKYTKCGYCNDQQGKGCFVEGILLECLTQCPSGSYLNDKIVP